MKYFWKTVAVVCALAAGISGISTAHAEEKASVRLNVLYYGFHSIFPLGVDKGFYKEEGIDLSIGEGQGSGRTVQIIGTQSDTFGMCDGLSLIAGVAKGIPVTAIMGAMSKSPFALVARADSNIKSAKDLEGKTIAVTTGETGAILFPAVVQANKLDGDKIKFVRVDSAGKLVAMLEKRVDAMFGGLENQNLLLTQRGLAVDTLPFSDIGASTVGLMLVANKETVARNPQLVQRFVRATQKSIAYAEKHPDEAISSLLKVKPDLDRSLALKQLLAGAHLVRARGGESRPIGWMNPSDWESTLRIGKEYAGVKTDLNASDFYTNKYVEAK